MRIDHARALRRLGIAIMFANTLCLLTWAQSSSKSSQITLEQKVEELNTNLDAMRQELKDSREELRELEHMMVELKTQLKSGSPEVAKAPEAQLEAHEPAQETLEVLQSEQQQLAQTKVESSSRYPVKLSGIVLFNAFTTRGTADNQDLPNLAFPHAAGGANGYIGATLRQTILGLEAAGPHLAGAATSADVHFDFFGGFPSTDYGVTAGLMRLRTAHLRLDWKNTSIIAEQDAPFFSPLSPTSLATLGQPALSWAGNLWTWTPQVRVEQRFALNDVSKITVEAGVLDPLDPGMPLSQSYRLPSHGEQSRQPGYATRVSWKHRVGEDELAFGAGGFFSPQRFGANRSINAWAGTADWSLPLSRFFQATGELYRGKAVGGLGGGLFNSTVTGADATQMQTRVAGLNSVGAWTQLKFKPNIRWEVNAAVGQDNPFARDLERFPSDPSDFYASRARNQISFLNFIYKPRSDLRFSVEGRHIQTFGISGYKNTVDHLNVSAGYLF